MGFKEELKKTGIAAIVNPLGYILSFVGGLITLYGIYYLTIEVNLVVLAQTLLGVIMLILGIALLRYSDKLLGKGPHSGR